MSGTSSFCQIEFPMVNWNLLFFRSIHTNNKEYGFGQSILYDGQLVFHTPPYSLQPVSLQECYENIGRANICVSHYDAEPKSPLSQTNIDPICSNSISPIDKSERQQSSSKEVKAKEIDSPGILDRKNRRISHTSVKWVLTTEKFV